MKYISIVFSCLSLLLMASSINAQCGELKFGTPQIGPSGHVELDVIYLNPPSNINSLDISINFSEILTDIDFTLTANSVNNSSYSASQGNNSRIVDISNTFPTVVSFTSSVICTIYFKLTKNKTTNVTFSTPAIFLVGGTTCTPSNLGGTSYTSVPVSLFGQVLRLEVDGTDETLDDILIEANTLGGSPTEDGSDLSNSTGNYSISLTAGESYGLNAIKQGGNHKCGLTTLDALVAQQHMVGNTPFTNPELQFIAADVNESNTLTTLDLVLMQRAIINDIAFPRNWAFMPLQEYLSLTYPSALTFDASKEFNALTQSTYTEFIGIKGGDVNTTCNAASALLPNNDSDIDYRNRQVFRLGKINARKDQELLIPVLSNNFKHQTFFSLGLQFESSLIEIIDIRPGQLPNLSQDAYAINKDQEGTVDLLWFTMAPEGVTLARNQVLFYIKAKLKQDIRGNYNLHRLVQLQNNRVDNTIYGTSSEGENIGIESGERLAIAVNTPDIALSSVTPQLTSFPNSFTV